MNTTHNAGEGAAPISGDAGQATDTQTQVIDQENETSVEGDQGAQSQYTPPTEEQWNKYQKDQAQTQRRFDKRTAQMHAALRRADDLEKRLAALEKGATVKKDERPSMDQFNSFDEYNEAVARWAARQEGQPKPDANEGAQKSERVPPQEAAWQKQMENQTINQARQLAQHIPDFAETWTENGEFFDLMPYELEKTFYQSQHPALAFYVLANEGKLYDLLEMSPQQAAHEIGRATHVGVTNIQSWAKKKPGNSQQPTGAPSPLPPNKGAGTSPKSEDTMSGKELLRKHGLV